MENKQETLEEAAERLHPDNGFEDDLYCDEGKYFREAWLEGAKWEQERSYSEEDLEVSFFEGRENKLTFKEWFEQFKNK